MREPRNLAQLFAALSALVCLCGASGFGISAAQLVNTAIPGQAVSAAQSPSTMQWSFASAFNLTQSGQAYASLNGSSLNYTDQEGRLITPAFGLQVHVSPGPEEALYPVSNSLPSRIYVMWSNITVGSVYQGTIYQNATPAQQCAPGYYYTEWDLYVTVQPSFLQSARNVVVGRVCIYYKSIGSAELLSVSPVMRTYAQVQLEANGQGEGILVPANGSEASSADTLASARLAGNYLSEVQPPSGSQYVAVGSAGGAWHVQTASAYSKWSGQYYKFTQDNIPSPKASYTPSSLSTLSDSCGTMSTSHLSNSSLLSAVMCMNRTAAVYYSLSNQFAGQLVSGSSAIAGYNATQSELNGNPAMEINLTARFTGNPVVDFMISGQFLAPSIPGGAARIIDATSSPIGLGGRGQINVYFQNTAKTAGLFTISLYGCPGIGTANGTGFQAGAGQYVNATVPISVQHYNLSVNERCSVAVSDAYGGEETRYVSISSATMGQLIGSAVKRAETGVCRANGAFSETVCNLISSAFRI